MKKHKDKKAAVVLARIYQTDEKGIEEELGGIGASVVNAEKEHFWQKLKVFYSWKFIQRLARHTMYYMLQFLLCAVVHVVSLYRRVLLGMWLQIFQRGIGGIAIS